MECLIDGWMRCKWFFLIILKIIWSSGEIVFHLFKHFKGDASSEGELRLLSWASSGTYFVARLDRETNHYTIYLPKTVTVTSPGPSTPEPILLPTVKVNSSKT